MTDVLLAWLIALGPMALALVGLVPGSWADRRPRLMVLLAVSAAALSFCCAVLAAVALATSGTISHVFAAVPAGGVSLELSVWVDSLSGTMLLVVSFIGLVVTGYSRHYLAGDPRHGRFMARLAATLAAVLTLVVAGNLAMLAVAWVATSMCLHRLLVFYPDRPRAQLAARKKFIISRLGDACLLGAIVLIASALGSLDFGSLLEKARALREAGAVSPAVAAAALLLVASAVLKSAQVPVHGWLTEVMETPTPVSALLHAGIINAGGLLAVRMASLLVLSPAAMHTLALIGAITALFGITVMLTQTSIKVSLAWSTVAQMGFMLLQCGLGAFPAAVLHIVAHSLYKAHAFLSAGGAVDELRRARIGGQAASPGVRATALGAVAAMVLAVGAGAVLGLPVTQAPGTVALGAVLLMSLSPLVLTAVQSRGTPFVALRALGLALGVCLAYFALQRGASHVLGPVLPAAPAASAFGFMLAGLIALCFGAVMVLQAALKEGPAHPRLQAFYVHLFNGFYLNTRADQLVRRLWPVEPRTRQQGSRP
ncbi:MAG TPA: NADH-quinone oxidoreductase subunit L [Myxococcaceae bacterium]|nr:NADH-quinone oxidoreductase subunit L [Myxococcaceae bacterium]